MYYILYEGLKIESNEPVYCTMYIEHCGILCTVKYIMYTVHMFHILYNYIYIP